MQSPAALADKMQLPMPVIPLDRKLSTAKGEIEMAASAKRQSFMKAPHEKPAMQYDADVLVQALCKPWEMGGHPHDFLVCHRSARTTDLYQHYETDKVMIKRHERLVSEKEAWNRQRMLREDMLNLLTRLHSVERQRRRFIEKRRANHPEDFEQVPDDYTEENANIKVGAINLANTFFEKRPSQLALMQQSTPTTSPAPSPWQHFPSGSHAGHEIVTEVPSPRTVALRNQVQDLDIFDEKLQKLIQPAAGSATSFPKKKKKKK